MIQTSYDATLDCGYIAFVDQTPGRVAESISVPIVPAGGQLVIDLGYDGRVVGIEVVGVHAVLPPHVLD